jgi:hypothetical protein
MAVRVAALRKALERYWTEQDCMTDVTFYSPEEWRERGERHGDGALLNVTFEGELYEHMNVPWEKNPPFEVRHRIEELAREHGLRFEQGYGWSMHFFRI